MLSRPGPCEFDEQYLDKYCVVVVDDDAEQRQSDFDSGIICLCGRPDVKPVAESVGSMESSSSTGSFFRMIHLSLLLRRSQFPIAVSFAYRH